MTHPLKGRKQTPEHIAKRMASWEKSGGREKSAKTCRETGKKNAGRKASDETKKRMSKAHKGKKYALGTVRGFEFRRKLSDYWAANPEKHNHYKDGKYAERKSFRIAEMGKLPYRLWREAVFERDNWTCVWCKQRGGKLCADHIKSWAQHPSLRYELDNGRTLCHECHKKTDTYCGRTPAERVAA